MVRGWRFFVEILRREKTKSRDGLLADRQRAPFEPAKGLASAASRQARSGMRIRMLKMAFPTLLYCFFFCKDTARSSDVSK